MSSTKHPNSKPLFPLRLLLATPAALERMARHGINGFELVARHVHGDWGDISPEDAKENEFSVSRHLRIFSSYGGGDERIWVITEADRSATTLLCPEDY
jgi:hypothetical protein